MLDVLLYLVAIALIAWLGYLVLTWWEFGQRVGDRCLDPLLDRFLPDWEVAERHEVEVRAPVDMTYTALRALDLEDSPLIRLIFRLRQRIMGAWDAAYHGPRTLTDRARAMGWGVLEEVPGRTVVLGAITRPWDANPVFQPLPPAEFFAFNEAGFAKIIWSIRAEPSAWDHSLASTETRVKLTDPASRRRFRLYWALVSPGVFLIRRCLLSRAKAEAESWTRARCNWNIPAGTSTG